MLLVMAMCTMQSASFTAARTRDTKAVTSATATTRFVSQPTTRSLEFTKHVAYQYRQDTITIYDATDKVGNTTNIISVTTFPGAEYIHQG